MNRLPCLLISMLLAVLLASCASRPYYDVRPSAPINISPSPAVDIIDGAETEFVWRSVQRVHHYEFHVFNRSNADINQYYMRNLDPAQVCAADRCSVVVPVQLPVNTGHAWRVRAINNVGASVWTRSVFNVVAR